MFKKPMLYAALVAAISSLSLSAQAHRAWFVPATTVLSGDEAWVTVDAAISNDIFHADYVAMRLDDIQVTAPDSSTLRLENSNNGKHRSTFDVHLKQSGTYRIATASQSLTARWQTADGEQQRWPARGTQGTIENFAKQVPRNAKDLQVAFSSRRIESFVTLGAPSTEVLAVSGRGLELLPITHPNDLFAGEEAHFQLFIDGKPAVGANVEVVAGGMRYRDSQDTLALTTDKKGRFSVTWPNAGLYWLSANYSDNQAQKPASKRIGSYAVTLEVLPQ